jgi:hypothetical protein
VLDVQLEAIDVESSAESDLSRADNSREALALIEVRAYQIRLQQELENTALLHALSTGGADAWLQLHAMEEDLIELGPRITAVSEALYDESRIISSRMALKDELLTSLRRAVSQLDLPAVAYLAGSTTAASEALTGSSTQPQEEAMYARVALRNVRRVLNLEQDTHLRVVLHARNRLLVTLLFSSLVLDVMVGFTLLAGVTKYTVEVATWLLLTGAIVGLFSQIVSETRSQTSGNSIGLYTTRLALATLLAGISALVGTVISVLLISGLIGLVTGSNPLPVSDLFDLTHDPFGLLLAAVWGLVSALIVPLLQP